MRENDVEIMICIGLFGASVISIVGDDSELVAFNIQSWGDAVWHHTLPEHEVPIEGVYKIVVDAWENDTQIDVEYEIKQCKHFDIINKRIRKVAQTKAEDRQLALEGV